jgi:hypothetical protein
MTTKQHDHYYAGQEAIKQGAYVLGQELIKRGIALAPKETA